MKKLIAVMMALCLLVAGIAAVAENAPKEIKWSDYEAEAAKVEGTMMNLTDTDLKLFVPAEFKEADVSEEAKANGIFVVFRTADEKAVVNVQLVKADVKDFKDGMIQKGAKVTDLIVNGINCFNFSVETNGVVNTCIALGTDQGNVIVFSFAPANQEPYTNLFRIMSASVQHQN